MGPLWDYAFRADQSNQVRSVHPIAPGWYSGGTPLHRPSPHQSAGAVPGVALVYADDAYVEVVARPTGARPTGPAGLMGRQVAGRTFLDAYLRFGVWSELTAVVPDRSSAVSLGRLWKAQPPGLLRGRRLRVVMQGRFHETFFPRPPAPLVHTPSPPEARFAWARQQGGPSAYALCGVTHTLCSAGAVEALCNLVTAPFEPFDALVCTSRAVEAMVRAVTGSYAEYLSERHGGAASLAVGLETIPLGVDTDRFRPAAPEERAACRAGYGVADDEVVALFVGRLVHHAKAHPFPMFRGLDEAARATGRRVHLLLAGWAAHPGVRDAFAAGARDFAPRVRTTLLDGTDPANRAGVWHAADLFVSLSDSVQETFGLAVVEAMASGLPVVASDWDGYRDLVADGETGYLVPTGLVEGSTADATCRLLLGEVSYDHFLAECGQATTVDVAATTDALTRLVGDEPLRRRMGDAGRRRALQRFAWPVVVRAYEALWTRQEADRAARAATAGRRWSGPAGPAKYPSPERSFAGYPTRRLGPDDVVQAVAGAGDALERLLATPLTNHAAHRRAADPAVYRNALAVAARPCTLADLARLFVHAGVRPGAGRATIAWMLKYDLLRMVPRGPGAP